MEIKSKTGTMNRRDFGKMAALTLSVASLPAALAETATGVAGSVSIAKTAVSGAVGDIDPLIGASTSVKLGEGKTFPGCDHSIWHGATQP